ncbi:hypothetical protein [Hymenobacter rubidus]|uniref:hypothetical protein n=1 Tax=Hymenobacter rubidus TaxID=1441626 RepID=UPI00191EBBAF|nr:hypothetical protein [Hymenobacter rubidus]
MKTLSLPALAALFAVATVFSSCEKTADSVVPVTASPVSADVKPFVPFIIEGGLVRHNNEVSPQPYWITGGAYGTELKMMLFNYQLNPKGFTQVYKCNDGVTDASLRPATLPYTFVYTANGSPLYKNNLPVADANGNPTGEYKDFYFRYSTVWDITGAATMTVVYDVDDQP